VSVTAARARIPPASGSAGVPDLSVFFNDAQIVWKGAAAYSANPATTDLIKATSGVSGLSSLAANDEVWVKY